MKRLVALLFAIVALVAACGSDDDGGAVASDEGTTTEAEFNEADVTFAQGMIPHHEQAVEMAVLAGERAESQEVEDLAARIEAAQDPEIETMTGWLEDWGQATEPGDGMDGMEHGGMAGMMTGEQMTMLEDLEGAEFDEQFLEMMAAHHRGAIEMAQTELDEGQFPDALALAEEIVESQTAEIEEIEELLAA